MGWLAPGCEAGGSLQMGRGLASARHAGSTHASGQPPCHTRPFDWNDPDPAMLQFVQYMAIYGNAPAKAGNSW